MSYMMNLLNGRNGRFEYWMVHIFLFIGMMLAMFIVLPVLAAGGDQAAACDQ